MGSFFLVIARITSISSNASYLLMLAAEEGEEADEEVDDVEIDV